VDGEAGSPRASGSKEWYQPRERGVSMSYRVFLLSPAHCGGRRARLLLRDTANFPLARRFREGVPVTLGEAFSFLSGLYFRGKLEYASCFALPPQPGNGVLVITPNRGLLPADIRVTLADLGSFGEVDIVPHDPRYRVPLERDAMILGASPDTEFVLLGSVASDKYAELLVGALGSRLVYPADFVGRGDMSRGALMLRAARSGQELRYQTLVGSVRRGPRAPRVTS
jgi:hypothetical protein